MGRSYWTIGLGTAFVVLLLTFGTIGGAMAQDASDDRIEITVEDSYDGLSEDGDQAIELEVTLAAQEDVIGLMVDFQETARSFIDEETLEVTVSDVEYERVGDSRYEVEELQGGQDITFSFEVYPRELHEESLDVALVRLEAENPQTYERTERLTADLNTSPLLAYWDEASSEWPLWLTALGAVAGVVGIGVAGFVRFVSLPNAVNEERDRFESAFSDLRSEISDPKCLKHINEIEDDYGGGNTTSIDDVLESDD